MCEQSTWAGSVIQDLTETYIKPNEGKTKCGKLPCNNKTKVVGFDKGEKGGSVYMCKQ